MSLVLPPSLRYFAVNFTLNFIAHFAIINMIVDGYQTVRDWKRVYDGDYSQTRNALWNTAETALDLLGAKFIKKGFKYSARFLASIA